MSPFLFEQYEAEDEIWLYRLANSKKLSSFIRHHRETYISEHDFKIIADSGMNVVRIPIPYFIFGDRDPYAGCITYLDRAFNWAEKYGLQIIIDLHTVPGSQNGYDNGGITGVCKWAQNPEDVAFALSVLKRLAERYGQRYGLYGIEVLNEPISLLVYLTSPSRLKARDRAEAKGSYHITMKFLKNFYLRAYRLLRETLPVSKAIIFHDGFRLGRWKRFFKTAGMENVILDTHIYILAMEGFIPLHFEWFYKFFLWLCHLRIRQAEKYIPVMIGEWSLSNQKAEDEKNQEKRDGIYSRLALFQWNLFQKHQGCCFWNYKLYDVHHSSWIDGWSFEQCLRNGWLP